MNTTKYSLLLSLLLVILLPVQQTIAAHNTEFDDVDSIDFTFASGGGSYMGSLDGTDGTGTDLVDYLVFNGTSGDSITISLEGLPTLGLGYINDPLLVLFDDLNNSVDIGDEIDVSNFSISNVGLGTDLIILAQDNNGGFDYNSLINFNLTSTGQFAIGITSYNNKDVGDYKLTLSGNSYATVPEPATLLLMGMGLVGFGVKRRKQETTHTSALPC